MSEQQFIAAVAMVAAVLLCLVLMDGMLRLWRTGRRRDAVLISIAAWTILAICLLARPPW